MWRVTSKVASIQFNETLDLVFIDGDHSYVAVREDIQAWRPFLRPGGILAGHDYHLDSVITAVHEYAAIARTDLHIGPDFTWWFLC